MQDKKILFVGLALSALLFGCKDQYQLKEFNGQLYRLNTGNGKMDLVIDGKYIPIQERSEGAPADSLGQEAVEWARKNASTPRAATIFRLNGLNPWGDPIADPANPSGTSPNGER